MRICIDAGHYGYQNNSPCDRNYWESKRMWTLHEYLIAALRRCGFEVMQTRVNQTSDLDTYYRGRAANECDLFLSLHSNTPDSTGRINNSVDRPVIIPYVDADSKYTAFAKKLGDTVRELIGAKQATQIYRKQGTNGEYYGVLRGAKAAGCPRGIIIEHGFHTCEPTVAYLMVDSNLKKIAEAEAKVICAEYGYKYVAEGSEEKPSKPAEPKKATLSVGDIVTIKPGASYWTGQKVPSAYVNKNYTVQQKLPGRCLIKELYSWVADQHLTIVKDAEGGTNGAPTPTPAPATPTPKPDTEEKGAKVKVGDYVKIAQNAVYYGTTQAPPAWAISDTWKVTQISGSRAVLGQNKKGDNSLNSAVDTKYLTVVTSTSSGTSQPAPTPAKPAAGFKEGDRVKINNPAYYSTGIRVPTSYTGRPYSVMQVNNAKKLCLIKELYSWVAFKYLTK